VNDIVSVRDLAAGAAGLHLDTMGLPSMPLVVVDLDDIHWPSVDAAVAALERPSVVAVGVSTREIPDRAVPLLRALTTTLAEGGPGRFWAGTPTDLDAVRATVAAAPRASVTLSSVLRVSSHASVVDALVTESLAYSMLLAGPEFNGWRRRNPRMDSPQHDQPVLTERIDGTLSIVLNRPQRHNAFGNAMRDCLLDALRLAELDDSIELVRLSGNGPSFCSGGDLDEFGTAPDVATAHLVRLQQSAGYAVHRIADRVSVEVHGACIGAGIEVPSFAGRIQARDGSWFMLPELAFGLLPGAGGTVSIPHRIGRWRTAYMALTGRHTDLDTAVDWGLVDARV
jgi:hypothetical protein